MYISRYLFDLIPSFGIREIFLNTIQSMQGLITDVILSEDIGKSFNVYEYGTLSISNVTGPQYICL